MTYNVFGGTLNLAQSNAHNHVRKKIMAKCWQPKGNTPIQDGDRSEKLKHYVVLLVIYSLDDGLWLRYRHFLNVTKIKCV